MTFDEYLQKYGGEIRALADHTYSPLSKQLPIHQLLRMPYPRQAYAIQVGAAILRRQKSLLIAADRGTGKTLISLGVAHQHADSRCYRCLVFCPPHLVDKWKREIQTTIPNAVCFIVRGWRDVVDRFPFAITHDDSGYVYVTCPIFYIISRNRAKAGDYNIARYINRKMRGFFDYLVIDEAHEEAAANSAQANAAGALISACRKVIALTGTLSDGYPEGVRSLLFRLFPSQLIGDGYYWSSKKEFQEKFGRVETTTVKNSLLLHSGKKKVATNKTTKIRPGIHPELFRRYLMPNTVFLSLEDVAQDMPPLNEQVVKVAMGTRLESAYNELRTYLSLAARQTMSRGDYGLMGQLLYASLCYPDHPFEWTPIGTSAKAVMDMMFRLNRLNHGDMLPKEEELLRLVRRHKQQGDQVWVFVEHTGAHDVQGRLYSVLSRHGYDVASMRGGSTQTREKWITDHKACDVIISHPKMVATGLELFSAEHGYNFNAIIFYQPNYSGRVTAQASRRSWRIGQTEPCYVYHLCYQNTVQEECVRLVQRKIAAAEALEGRFTTTGLLSMLGEDDESSVQRQLAEYLAG